MREEIASHQDHPGRSQHKHERVKEPRQRNDGMVKGTYATVGMLAR
jgi:hypothetical protein